MKTGWIKYRFGSAASRGEWEYVYAPNYCEDGVRRDDVEEFLIDFAVWPRYQDCYRGCEIELNSIPPIKLVHEQIIHSEAKIKQLRKMIKSQQKLFDKLLEIN